MSADLESYVDCNGKRCYRPRGEGDRMRAENHARRQGEKLRHFEHVSRELLALRLDAIDADWPQKFLSTAEAARHYRDELAAMEQAR